MTEKRFLYVLDNGKDTIYDLFEKNILSKKDIEDRMNALYEENNQLKETGLDEKITKERFTTNGYKIYDTFHDGMYWLINEVEAEDIVEIMNNLDTKARERSKALSKLQKENEQLKSKINKLDDKLYFKECDIFDLKKENEQLKSDLKYWTKTAEARLKTLDRIRELEE